MMKRKLLDFLIGIGLLTATVLFFGCTTNRINYINEASVLFERALSEDVHISEVYAYENGDELIVRGTVKRSPQYCCDPARGHVDIAVLGSDGLVLDMISTLYSPRNIPKVRSRSSHFTVQLPYTLPDGVTVRVAYHNSVEVAGSAIYAGDMFVCEENIAIPDEEG
jgi:hypothetical protein